jgi:hypothetical protein
MKRRFISWVYAAFVLLAALAFPGCPLEDETPGDSTIRLTNMPPEVLNGNKYAFLGVFESKTKISPGIPDMIMQPFTGHVSNGLQFAYGSSVGNPTEVSFNGLAQGRYVLVLGLAPDMVGINGTTYTTNGDGSKNDTGGGGDFMVPGSGAASIAPVLVSYNKNGVAEIDFSKNFKATGTRPQLLANKGAW